MIDFKSVRDLSLYTSNFYSMLLAETAFIFKIQFNWIFVKIFKWQITWHTCIVSNLKNLKDQGRC